MNLNFKALLRAIEDADIITLFRHVHPDCDALSSQNGLYCWIKLNYPEKRVYRLGEETTDQTVYPPSDIVDHLSHALLLELRVPHRQDLVDHQDLRIQVRGHGEGQAHVHAAGVALHRRVQKLLHPREVQIGRAHV